MQNVKQIHMASHNPYFSRWFSAIYTLIKNEDDKECVTILILVDGFLQYHEPTIQYSCGDVTILILVDGFLQLKVNIPCHTR